MRKRILSLLLSLCIVLSLFAGTATAVGERVATIYDDAIGHTATFNPYYIGQGSFPISDAPEQDESWFNATQYAGNADLVMVIVDAMVVRDEYWYKVEAAEGYELPAELAAEPWIFQNTDGTISDSDSLIIDLESAPEEILPEETVPEETVPETTEPDNTDPNDPSQDDPSQDDPSQDDPTQDDPSQDDPSQDDPTQDDPSQDDPSQDDPTQDDPTPDDTESDVTELVWMSYSDYITAQMETIFADPGLYVGHEAAFDLIWSNFRYAADPSVAIPGEDENLLSSDLVTDAQGNGLHIKITGFVVDADGQVWYQIEAAEGYTLPDVLVENPYILHAVDVSDTPSLVILPWQGMFVGETVDVLKNPEGATPSVTLPTAELPDFFDVQALVMDAYGSEYYDLGDVTGWHATLLENGYHYVSGTSVMLIPPEVSAAYEKLNKADSAEEFNEIWENLPESVRNLFTDKHLNVLDQKQEALYNVEYETVVEYNGVSLNVSVVGPIPQSGVTLHVSPVSNATVLSEGFDINDVADIITALDIKLLRDDNSEWQPADGERITVSIDMASLGVPNGTVVRVHHKHEDRISVSDVFVVMSGKLTVRTSGFSIYVVEKVLDETKSQQVTDGSTIELDVGETVVLYYDYQNTTQGGGWPGMGGGNNNNWNGTWIVDDPYGAIYYTVHSDDENSTDIGHDQVKAQWIKIVVLKQPENDETIDLQFSRGNATESVSIRIKDPIAQAGRKWLYLKDEVNTSGCLVATVVDENGNEVSLEGAAFSWKRSDNLFIVPTAYEQSYRAVNIARDHGGLVEARKTATGYTPTTYTLDVILADGTELSASYTVYYQSEIINAGFEFPKAATSTYSFFPNGYPELYWKTTAPGTSTNHITKDVEYGNVTNQSDGGANYSVKYAADHATGGVQFAELNAEEIGSLYQDIITAPHEDIVWKFAHARRANAAANRMYLVIGATENAQKLSNDQLNTLVLEAKQKAGNNNQAFLNGQEPYKLTFSVDGKEYWVWYHSADNQTNYNQNANYGWEVLKGSYEVPSGQYRTRIFFVSDPATNGNNKNYGNLIDTSTAGQYKTYMIEYYEQTYEGGVLVTKRLDDCEETGSALIYSSVILDNYQDAVIKRNDYLYKILINGQNYPYDLHFAVDPNDPVSQDQAALYIEKYEGTPVDQLPGGNKSYEGYQIVMQVMVRDTVVAVQKQLVFPTTVDSNGKVVELLTEEQKLTIMADLNKNGGYQATFSMDTTNAETNGDYVYHQVDSAVVTNRDPAGNYKGFIALGDNPKLEVEYQIEEIATTQIPGLELDQVVFGVTRYSMGTAVSDDDLEIYSYDETHIQNGEPLVCDAFKLEGTIKIADVTVTNTYREKVTKIYYKAVGNGKVTLNGQTDYVDTPMEELAFYSDKSEGVQIHTGNGAFFVGWFKDPECQNKVTAVDGVVDPVTGEFRPNANIINADEITFYAKFSTASITINRTGAEKGQSFVYHVTGKTNDNQPVDLYVTLICGKDGSGSTTITEMMKGTYHVEEVTDWSWRFDCTDTQKDVTITGDKDNLEQTVTFTGDIKKPKWLSGLAEIVDNIFKGGSS